MAIAMRDSRDPSGPVLTGAPPPEPPSPRR
ncbi:DUF397 domain-containing protein [Actinocatenispora sera]